jgi:hypothetical protein
MMREDKERKMKTVICKSGIKGWQEKLQKVYVDYGDFCNYDVNYNISKRLGYASSKIAWKKNPVIQASVIPSDLRKVFA